MPLDLDTEGLGFVHALLDDRFQLRGGLFMKVVCRKMADQALDEALSLLLLPMGEVLGTERKPALVVKQFC